MDTSRSSAISMSSILVIIFGLVTAAIHLFLGIGDLSGGMAPFGILFILNAIGYAVLVGGVVTNKVPVLSGNKALAHWSLIGFTALTFVLYFLMSGVLDGQPAGVAAIVTKVDEVLLIVATFLHMRK
ncbi:MAG: hypothetical protein JXB38_14300 [Anaerolineales bacterium]|nr:hypothetical protein [Anaerolineales bacterium]